MLAYHDTTERTVTYLRWAVISALVYMILLGGSGRAPATLPLVYVAALLASNLIVPRVPCFDPETFGSLLLAIDTLFVLVGVLLCSSRSQDLLIAYFLCVIMASFADSQRRVAGAAVLVTGVYSFWLFQNLQAMNRASLLIRLPFLFITTVFYGYMMQRVRGEHAQRLRSEDEARGLHALLQVTQLFSSSLLSAQILEQASAVIRTALMVDRCRIQPIAATPSELLSEAASEALEHGRPVLRSDETKEFSTAFALPILHDAEALGVLVVEQKRPGRTFRPEEIEFCKVIAQAAASALKNARQYEALAETARAKSDFLANISHELRTPLTTIIGFSRLLAEQFAHQHGSREMVARISNSAAQMRRHVDNLLVLSSATIGRECKNMGPVDVTAMLNHVVGEAELLRRDNVDFALDVDPRIGRIYTDGEKLQRVVENILLNAVKFTHRGTVKVCAKLVDKKSKGASAPANGRPQAVEKLLCLSVTDTGIGMSRAEIGGILRGFRQAKGGRSREYGGLGIGLAAARQLTKVLGGEIRVHSSPDRGSEFEVLVPVLLAA